MDQAVIAPELPSEQVDAIIREARDWIGTPYQHQASRKHCGTDCLGLIRGIWRALYGEEPELPPAYTPDWASEQGEETLRNAAARHLWAVPLNAACPGDVLLFRMSANAPAKHAAVLVSETRIIHAYWGRAVTESLLRPFWSSRLAYVFRFPLQE